MSKSKDKGTKRETFVVRLFQSYGLDAQRAPNNLHAKDVELRVNEKTFAIEVKDRRALNLHATMSEVVSEWGDKEIPAVVWHRTVKEDGAKRASPAGPTIIALRLDDFARLMAGRTE